MNGMFGKGHTPWNKGKRGLQKGHSGSFKKGTIPWNKGKRGVQVSWNKGMNIQTNTGRTHFKVGFIQKTKGTGFANVLKHCCDCGIRINPKGERCQPCFLKYFKGEKHSSWRGGITALNDRIKNSFNMRQWRSDIYARDKFTCQHCGEVGGNLNAHHIKHRSHIMQWYEITTFEQAIACEELWNINNGITLCKDCHKKIHRRQI